MNQLPKKKYYLFVILGCFLLILCVICTKNRWDKIEKATQSKNKMPTLTNYSFKSDGTAIKHLLTGWYNPEENFIWASENADIQIPLNNSCDYDMSINYLFHTLSENTTIYINNIELFTLDTTKKTAYVHITRDLLNENGSQIISFRTTGACSPYSIGSHEDTRILGVAIQSINIFPINQPLGNRLYNHMGMIYLISSAFLVTVFLLYKKDIKDKNFWRSFAIAIVSYECYLCLLAGLMAMIHIPVDVFSISFVNIICATSILFRIMRQKNIQKYYLRIDDSLFIIFFTIFIICIFFRRFTPDLKIIFETSDPGVHLRMAMDFVNSKTVNNMYIGQLLDGLFIESLMGIFDGELVYKSFIIQRGINLYVSGIMFWAVVQKDDQGITMRLVTYAVTLVYILDYPYNDFLYGFVYLQMTITVICYLIGIMQDYMEAETNIWTYGLLIGAGCLSIGIGYTLFAPPVYISIFVLVVYKAFREKWLFSNNKLIINKRFIFCNLTIFLLPSILTLWFILIAPRLNNGSFPQIGNSLRVEGGIYRNLYSDFVLYSIPAVYGIIYGIRSKKINLLSFLCPIFGLYYFLFLYRMLSNEISTYYFYKLNYLLWMIILVAFTIGIAEFFRHDKILFITYISGVTLLVSIFFTNVENFYQEKNSYYMGYTNSNALFRVFECNKNFLDNSIQTIHQGFIPQGLVDISHNVLNMNPREKMIFIGHWMHLYWYEALTGQRLEANISHEPYEKVIEDYKNGTYGEYAVVRKDDFGDFGVYQQYILDNIIYESDYAYIIKR